MSRVTPDRGGLAGRWPSKFLTDHLAGERDLSPQTIASYRDAIKLLLTWFRDVQGTPPEKLRIADLDRSRVLAFLDWLETERGNSPATRNQRLAVIKSLARYTAIERPEFLDQATQIIAVKQKKTPATDMGHLTGDEVKTLLAAPDPTTRRGLRDTVLLSTLYDSAARVQEICDLNTADVRTARPMLVTLHGKGSKTRNGRFKLRRVTSKKKMQAKLKSVKTEMRKRMHHPIPEQGRWLARVLQGHYNYYAVPDNSEALRGFRREVIWHWRAALSRRSQKGRITWQRMDRLAELWLPQPRILHPWPHQRFDAKTRGRSPVR